MANDTPERVKDPAERLDYGFNLAAPPPKGPWLTTGDTVTASTWAITAGTDGALTIENPDFTTTSTRCWLVGGTLGQDYTVTNHATTAQGRQFERSIIIKIRNR